MAIYKHSVLFAVTTAPVNLSVSSPHSGGWSEGFWANFIAPNSPNSAAWLNFLQQRARLLPIQVSIVGWRVATYVVIGNRLQPAGSVTGKLNLPGNGGYTLNMPQDGLELSIQGAGVANVSRPILRAIPDQIIVQGEYQPDPFFNAAVPAYLQQLAVNSYGFVGRDLTQAYQRVNSFAAGQLITQAAIPGVGVGSYIRFHRVFDDNGNPVRGTYQVSAIGGPPFEYTLLGPPAQTVSKPNGTVRLDLLVLYQFGAGSVGRAVVKKIGRPFSSYRGRRSKRRV
jgi:hypothetical protein